MTFTECHIAKVVLFLCITQAIYTLLFIGGKGNVASVKRSMKAITVRMRYTHATRKRNSPLINLYNRNKFKTEKPALCDKYLRRYRVGFKRDLSLKKNNMK